MGKRIIKLTSDTVFHAPGKGSNVLCCNGSAHRKTTRTFKLVDCPACRAMLDSGCSVTEAIEAWEFANV